MREIKLRVWNEDEYISLSKAIKDDLVGVQEDFDNYYFNQLESFYESVVIEQYTGLKDNNGLEVYEGDIVEVYTSKSKYAVHFKNGAYFIGDNYLHEWVDMCEIIGNIHENKELLK